MELHAHYIVANGGKIQIGTEAEPLKMKFTLTLYGILLNIENLY